MDLLLTDGDLTLTDGDLALTTAGVEDVAQAVLVTLQTHRGEWALDVTLGVPWRERVLGKGRDMSAVALLLRAIIEEVPGVLRVERVVPQLDATTRALSVRVVALVEGADGQAQLDVTAAEDSDGYLAWTNGPLGGW